MAETVASREGKIRGTGLEIAHIVSDWRSKVCGGMVTALFIWEVCCIPSLLSGAGTWIDITTTTERRLNVLQCWYLKLIFQTGPGSPSASLLWDTKTLNISLRIWKEKVLLIIHIRNLDSTTPARKIYDEQKGNSWPGLAEETRIICEKLSIEDCNVSQVSKGKYVQILNRALHKKNEQWLRILAKGKCERFTNEEYGRKDYISKKNIFDVRIRYRSRFGLLAFAGNYQNEKRFANSNWLCRCTKAREDESHLR